MRSLNRKVFTKIVLIFCIFFDLLCIVLNSRIDYSSFVSDQLNMSVVLEQVGSYLVIESIFFLIVFIPRLRALNKSLLWSVVALIPFVNIYYCVYLCIKKSDDDEIEASSLPTRKGMKRIPYLLTLLPFMFVILIFHALSKAMIDNSLPTLGQDIIVILWCYFCLSKRLIDAGEDPYKAWLILVPFYNIYFLLKWCFVRSASA